MDNGNTTDSGRNPSAMKSSSDEVPEPSPEPSTEQVNSVFANTSQQLPAENTPPPPPNGGYGWVCTACVATINGHSWGLNSTYGVFLAYYLANNTFDGATHLDYAFVGSVSIGTTMLISPIATIAVRELGTKPTMLCGAVLESLSLILASLAKRTWHLFLTQGLLFGLGMGLLFIPSVGIIPQWFTTRRSLANGLATAGSGLGGLTYSLASGAMLRTMGLQWTFRILSIITLVVNIICILLLKDRNKIIGSSQLAFDASLLKRLEYQLLLGFGSFSMLAYVVLVFSLANYANEIGLTPSQGAVVSALFNLGQAIGRPLVGYFSDYIGRINMATLMTLLAGILSLTVWVNAKSYGVLIFFAMVEGTVAGTVWVTIAPVMAEVIGLRHIPSGLNLFWLALVLPSLFSEPMALEIVAGTGSYIGTQLFTGLMFIVAALCMGVLRGWKINEDSLVELLGDTGMELGQVAAEDRKTLTKKQQFLNCFRWETV
ncbi:hypothetical protein G7046_g4982 [Stylonectria norvegica]|nr:hypothetical protein G7046_g4982 [Stylonectria norvegica]